MSRLKCLSALIATTIEPPIRGLSARSGGESLISDSLRSRKGGSWRKLAQRRFYQQTREPAVHPGRARPGCAESDARQQCARPLGLLRGLSLRSIFSHGEEFRPFEVRIRDAQARTHRGHVGDDLYFAVSGLRKGSAVRRLPAAAVVSRLADIRSVRVRGLLVVAALSLSCHRDVLSRQILAASIVVIWLPLRCDCSIFGSWHAHLCRPLPSGGLPSFNPVLSYTNTQ